MRIPPIILSAVVLLAVTASAQTNVPVLKMHRVSIGAPAVLEWSSQTNALYRVDYTVGLTNWTTISQGLPAQGTNTLWTDTGYDGEIAVRYPSSDVEAPYRFYRVVFERFMSNATPISVTISNISNGAVLSGATNIIAGASASQGVSSVKLCVNGDEAFLDAGDTYDMPLETRFYPNGTHRLSIIAQDAGAWESTEETNPASGLDASFGVQNVTVTFTNLLSNVRLRHRAFRPDLGQTQVVSAVWSSPRSWMVTMSSRDGLILHRSFTGEGTKVLVPWDGKDSVGTPIDPQIVEYAIYDLGPGEDPGGGGSGGISDPPPPGGSGTSASESSFTTNTQGAPPMPPSPWDSSSWNQASSSGAVEPITLESMSTATGDSATQTTELISAASSSGEAFAWHGPVGIFATFGLVGQGHHPAVGFSGQYPTPPRFGGRVRMTAGFGPYGSLKAPQRISNDANLNMAFMGYRVLFQDIDDACEGDDLRKESLGGQNVLNTVNLGMFVGHSAAAIDAQTGYSYPQSYVPVYNSLSDTMDWVGTSEMNLGSQNLKWMAFYSCNMFRDGLYRSDANYHQMKNNFALPMNGYLHVMQGFATEMSVHPNMIGIWTAALSGKTRAQANHTVIGAWNYLCRKIQPKENASNENVARSIFWPECQGDFIYGYGPQTDPNRDPEDPLEQADLQEIDERATAIEP